MLEAKFADYYDLPVEGTVTIAGGVGVDYTALGMAPEQFYVVSPEGSMLAHADLAHLYGSLATVQELTGRAGQVNDVVLTLIDGADRDRVAAEIDAALDALPGVGATVTTRDDADAYRVLYEDIDNDQAIFNVLSALVLVAAALAAFNLISRIVEAQRREIGIGMALGLPRWRLAIRPVLVGVQVGLLGTALGVVVGLVIGRLMGNLLESFLPLPEPRNPFQVDMFARGAVLGLIPPVAASLLAVWRAVRVEPIQAIRTGHLAATGGRIAGWANRLRLPGSSITQMPARNLLRAPRRTLLTAIGVGAAITALVAVFGMLDSFTRAIDQGAAEVTRGDPERVTVGLDTFYMVDSPEVAAIAEHPSIATADPSLRLPATIRGADDDASGAATDGFEVLLEVLDFDTAGWTPTIVRADDAAGATSGLVLARKAASDLGVDVGDTVSLRHPRVTATGFEFVWSELAVSAIHPNPMRTFAFLDVDFADEFGLGGVVNGLQVTPSAGLDRGDVQRAVFPLDGVASAQPVARLGEMFDDALEQFVGFLVITAGAVLLLALLIAFNSTRIAVEERRRENATMLAYGLRLRTVLGVIVREAVAIGLLATVIGLAVGMVVVRWILTSLAQTSMPDLGIDIHLSLSSILLSVIVGVVAVAFAPLLLVRRVKNMDLPATLRVME